MPKINFDLKLVSRQFHLVSIKSPAALPFASGHSYLIQHLGSLSLAVATYRN